MASRLGNLVVRIQTILSVAGGKRRCIATFVPKCEFKPVESGNIIPQVSSPFAKCVEGKLKVNITFSVKGLNSISKVRLYKNKKLQRIWNGMNVNEGWKREKLSLTENTDKGQLDGTVVYKRVNGEEITNFEIKGEKSNARLLI
nr:hypothetical transcript [Hymenolepis microstoma]